MLRILVLYLILVACFSYVFEHTFGMFFARYCALNKSQYLPTQHRRHLYFVSDMGNGSSQARFGLAKTDFRASMGNETLEAPIVLKPKNSACHETELSTNLLKKCKSATVASLQRDV